MITEKLINVENENEEDGEVDCPEVIGYPVVSLLKKRLQQQSTI